MAYVPLDAVGQYANYFLENYAELPPNGINGSMAFLCDLNNGLTDEQIIHKLEILLKTGIDNVNKFLGDNDYIPLHHASSRGRVKLVQWIMQNHRDKNVNVRNHNGFTALKYARRTINSKNIPNHVKEACYEIINILIQNGARDD